MAELTEFEKGRAAAVAKDEKKPAPKRKKKKEALTEEQIREKVLEEQRKVRDKYLAMWGDVNKGSEIYRTKHEVAGFTTQFLAPESVEETLPFMASLCETGTEAFWVAVLRIYWDWEIKKREVRQYANASAKYSEQAVSKRGPQLWGHAKRKAVGESMRDNGGRIGWMMEVKEEQKNAELAAATANAPPGQSPPAGDKAVGPNGAIPVVPGNWFDEDIKITADMIKDQNIEESQAAALHFYCTKFEPVLEPEEEPGKKKGKKKKKEPEPAPIDPKTLEATSLESESKSFFRVLNSRMLERDLKSVSRFLPMTKLIMLALSRMPVHEGTLFRTMTHCEKTQWKTYQDMDTRVTAPDGAVTKHGASFAWYAFVPAFISRSNSDSKLSAGPASITHRILFEIKTIESYRLHVVADNADEDEAVFPPYSCFEVIERVVQDEMMTIKLEQRPQPYVSQLLDAGSPTA